MTLSADAPFLLIWEFSVRSGSERQFEEVYGPDGAWMRLFRTAKGYLRTELHRDSNDPRRYLTFDF